MFYIFNIKTERRARKNCFDIVCSTLRGAKGVATRMNKEAGEVMYAPMSVDEFYRGHDPLVTVKNVLSGAPCQIRRSQVGTINDPSREAYFCF